MMPTSPQSRPSPLTPEQWEAEFIRTLKSPDFQLFHDPLVLQLLADADTLSHAAKFVRWYVCDSWEKWRYNRAERGEAVKNLLRKAVAGQKVTIRVFTELIAGLDVAQIPGVDSLDPLSGYLEMSRQLLAKLENMSASASAAYSSKPLGYKGDLQTLDALDWLLQIRLGKSAPETLSTLLECGSWVAGGKPKKAEKRPQDPVGNLRKRLHNFRANNPLAQRTEAFIRSIPRK